MEKVSIRLLEKSGAIRILAELSRNEEGLYFSELKEKSGVPNGSMQRRLKELPEAGLIDKNLEEDESGRARKRFRLSEQGRKLSEFRIAQLGEWMKAEEDE